MSIDNFYSEIINVSAYNQPTLLVEKTNELETNIKESLINIQEQTNLMHMFYVQLYENLPSIKGLNETIFDKLEKAVNKSALLKEKSENIQQETEVIQKTEEEVKFPCNFCSKIYKSKENLTLHHMNFHLKQKPFTCKACNKKFSNRMGMSYHLKSLHNIY